VLGEFGDDPQRFTGARARKNYAGNSPITRASGKKKTVTARRVRNNRLADPLHQQAFSALTCSAGARAYYDTIRARGTSHHAALRQLSNRLVGILHGCLATRTLYDEHTAWNHQQEQEQGAGGFTSCVAAAPHRALDPELSGLDPVVLVGGRGARRRGRAPARPYALPVGVAEAPGSWAAAGRRRSRSRSDPLRLEGRPRIMRVAPTHEHPVKQRRHSASAPLPRQRAGP
jgi:hypothetical protein